MRRKILSISGVAVKDFVRNNCPYMAAGMAIMLGAQTAYTYRGIYGTHAGEIELPVPKPKVTGRRRGWRGLLTTPLSWLLPPKEERL